MLRVLKTTCKGITSATPLKQPSCTCKCAHKAVQPGATPPTPYMSAFCVF